MENLDGYVQYTMYNLQVFIYTVIMEMDMNEYLIQFSVVWSCSISDACAIRTDHVYGESV